MSNEMKHDALGINFSTATQRLRKLIMWSLVQETGKDVCFRCGNQIENVDDLSIEHKAPWQSAPDPQKAFFDLNNIAFSHLRCNSSANGNSRKTDCPYGHALTEENTYRDSAGRRSCRRCRAIEHAGWRSGISPAS